MSKIFFLIKYIGVSYFILFSTYLFSQCQNNEIPIDLTSVALQKKYNRSVDGILNYDNSFKYLIQEIYQTDSKNSLYSYLLDLMGTGDFDTSRWESKRQAGRFYLCNWLKDSSIELNTLAYDWVPDSNKERDLLFNLKLVNKEGTIAFLLYKVNRLSKEVNLLEIGD